jgi:hypothetical protein
MSIITKAYAMEFELKFATQYKWSKCGKCFNSLTSREIKQSYKSRCIGYYIQSRFYSLTYLRTQLQKIPKETNPF